MKYYTLKWIPATHIRRKSLTFHTTRDNNNDNDNDNDNDNNTDWLHFLILYISDAVDYKIKIIFKKEGLTVRIAHKSTTADTKT